MTEVALGTDSSASCELVAVGHADVLLGDAPEAPASSAVKAGQVVLGDGGLGHAIDGSCTLHGGSLLQRDTDTLVFMALPFSTFQPAICGWSQWA